MTTSSAAGEVDKNVRYVQIFSVTERETAVLKIRVPSPKLQSQTMRQAPRVAIVGGGYTGAIVAKLLVERGVREIEEVTLFEHGEKRRVRACV